MTAATGSFTVTSTGTFAMCYRASGGSDSVEQSAFTLAVVAATSATAVTAISPTSISEAWATTIRLTGGASGTAIFIPSGSSCATATPNVGIDVSNNGIFTVATDGSYKLCFQATGGSDSIEQTGITLTVIDPTPDTVVTAIDIVQIIQGTSNTITLSGTFSAGDLATFSLQGTCAATTPSADVSSGPLTVSFSTVGFYELCYRRTGGSDSIKQSAILMAVVVTPTQSNAISSISPLSITVSWSTPIRLTGGGSGDKATFAAQGSCASATPDVTLDGNGDGSFTVASMGNFDLCFRKSGRLDSVKQDGVVLTVIAATPSNMVTASSDNTVTVSTDISIALTGSSTLIGGNDRGIFAFNCASATPNFDTSTSEIVVNLASTGNYVLCMQKHGGSDSVQQTGITLTVSAAPMAGTDPVAVFGDTRREFSLPPGVMHALLKAPDMLLHGETFEGGGPWEQFFGRVRVSSPDGLRWLELRIKPDIAKFNRTRAVRGAFETLEVIASGTDPGAAPVRLHGPGARIAFEFLGADIAFRTIQRNHNTRNPMIGRARRECMDIAGHSLHLFICSNSATEYYGVWRHLAIQYAHLDIAVNEVHNFDAVEGLLPELWGVRPMSEETAARV
eukprot:CAMPEP_0198572306 /NCGR_PEP_ID=MMETSP1462-20131121/111654_1 /TAXON_ID=1333877 /ORGANISM="Brandtodinium nutriculum, Strain RCC3387" /LENGTH=619 /DNA_ID=CAMNT_0044303459 /DNA_START=16 /DNA_END=1871 /DNA_ORIENTATION=-